MLHEVVDPDDVRMLHLGQEAALGDGRGLRIRVTGVQQALEHDPPVADVPVPGEVAQAVHGRTGATAAPAVIVARRSGAGSEHSAPRDIPPLRDPHGIVGKW